MNNKLSVVVGEYEYVLDGDAGSCVANRLSSTAFDINKNYSFIEKRIMYHIALEYRDLASIGFWMNRQFDFTELTSYLSVLVADGLVVSRKVPNTNPRLSIKHTYEYKLTTIGERLLLKDARKKLEEDFPSETYINHGSYGFVLSPHEPRYNVIPLKPEAVKVEEKMNEQPVEQLQGACEKEKKKIIKILREGSCKISELYTKMKIKMHFKKLKAILNDLVKEEAIWTEEVKYLSGHKVTYNYHITQKGREMFSDECKDVNEEDYDDSYVYDMLLRRNWGMSYED